ncbi:hypothetical protein WR25_14221 isoform B [Diploscapter pachys]|uniref:GST N-terminal domain-containing protein n=1 Tax=Diploscapter pachys TaxID=2018661 RepID=A0A2A2LN42_9BILA|nr:hypothetical protein WR25_14221 isoform B [Diploscapter pachys]
MSESKGKLELFTLPGKGRAEAIRMMLVFVDKKFTDTRLTIEQWKIKRQLSNYGNDQKLPMMLVNDKRVIFGATEISRFVALNFSLYGVSSSEQEEINKVIDDLEKINVALTPIIRATLTKSYEQRKELWNVFKVDTLFPPLTKYDERLANKMFLVGSRISWADIALIEMLTRFREIYDSFYLAHFDNLRVRLL